MNTILNHLLLSRVSTAHQIECWLALLQHGAAPPSVGSFIKSYSVQGKGLAWFGGGGMELGEEKKGSEVQWCILPGGLWLR